MRFPNKKIRYLFTSLVLIPTLVQAGNIPVVGLDKDHKETTVEVTEAEFMNVLTEVINSVNQSTLQTLQNQEAKPFVPFWMLRDVCVGLGLTFSVGLGPIWSMTAAPRVRLGYSNSSHPVIPD